tara:strand:+ start:18510 stop:20339 length:1830 start_codon:yes stop_codon:yes gene_type:complete
MNLRDKLADTSDHDAIPQSARLRILETTDLHMQLLGYDYFADHPTPDLGLVPLAGLIESYRNDPTVTTLLFDNGDFLQGNPLADYVVGNAKHSTPNPMIAAFNVLGYDAVALGNHEFNYGTEVLENALKDAQFPVVCANVKYLDGTPLRPSHVLIGKDIMCRDGQIRQLRVGVFGVVPPQILRWDKAILDGKLTATDIVETAAALTPKLRAQGADIIVALCHSGIGSATWEPNLENAAVPLAALPDVDVVLAGHTHSQFPDPRDSNIGPIDHDKGTIHGKPTVMAGFYGSHLGVLTLDIAWEEIGWKIIQSKSQLKTPDPTLQSALQKQITGLTEDAHQETLAHIRQAIAQTRVGIHSHYATTAPDLTLELLADAQLEHLKRASIGTVWQDVPLLSVAAPFRVGGRGGPNHFIDIPAGPLTLRDAAAIYPFTNKLYGVFRSGAQIRAWLEKSSRYFNTLQPNEPTQLLINPDVPPYDFDVIYGLTYAFDLTRDTDRVTDLRFDGHLVKDTDRFIVATNSYRASGGGNFFAATPDEIAYVSADTTRNILIDRLRNLGTLDNVAREIWRFAPIGQAAAWFTSSATAVPPKASNIRASGKTRDGFGIFTLTV